MPVFQALSKEKMGVKVVTRRGVKVVTNGGVKVMTRGGSKCVTGDKRYALRFRAMGIGSCTTTSCARESASTASASGV
jgi:hypothetical protein